MAKEAHGLWANVKTIFWGVIIALVIRSLLFQPFTIPSGSMIPTLRIGDYIIVSKYSYGYSRFSFPFSPNILGGSRLISSMPERGDVVVFRLPSDTSIDYVKRAVALPGDRVQMKDGRVYLNGALVPQKYMGCGDGNKPEASCWRRVYMEDLSGYEHLIMDSGVTRADNTREFLVPEGHVFMMGDNRDNSEDSRLSVGFVPMENLVGKAQLVLFSVGEEFSLWAPSTYGDMFRLDRFFTIVD